MIVLLKLIVLSSIFVLAFKIATKEGMLLEKIGNWAQGKVDNGGKAYMLLICPFCMGSVFSIAGFGFAFITGIVSFTWNTLWYYIPCVCGVSIVAGFTWSIYEAVNAAKENHEAITRNLDEEYYRNEPAYYEETNSN